jgi:hypothetical protein
MLNGVPQTILSLQESLCRGGNDTWKWACFRFTTLQNVQRLPKGTTLFFAKRCEAPFTLLLFLHHANLCPGRWFLCNSIPCEVY